MTAPVCKLSIVCPAYEEEEVLPAFHAELSAVLDGLGPGYDVEVLYVDDGSRDRTLPLLRRLAAADGRVRYLSLSRNFGHQAALTAGMEHAAGDVLITMDSDLQHPPAVIPQLLARWREGHDVVVTLREQDPTLGWFKRVSSDAFYKIMRVLSDTEMRTAVADFRLMTRPAAQALVRMPERHRFLRGMVSWLGFPTATVNFTPASRGAGQSKFTLTRMVGFALDGMMSFSKLPLRLALGLGLGATAAAALVAAVGVLHGLFAAAPTDWGWYGLMATLLLVGGAVLGSLGVLGEYVGRIYEQVRGRPIYLIKEASPAIEAVRRGAAA
jgi:polyisoprenyl-phosphate glycosyltransferase